MITLLKNLGFSSFEAGKLIESFGNKAVDILSDSEKLQQLKKIVDAVSVRKAHLNLCCTSIAKNLFLFFRTFRDIKRTDL